MPRKSGVVVSCEPKTADVLTVVRVDGESVTLSTGEILIARYEKLRTLCEQLVQEGCPISARIWIASDGAELIEAHRVGVNSIEKPTATLSGGSDAF